MKIIDKTKSVYYERYKPQCLQDVILPAKLKNQLVKNVAEGTLQHMCFVSVLPGSGKSSCCNAILNDVGGEALWINASLENGIDVVRGKISKFASQNSFLDAQKIVVMDECDNLSPDAQKAFRGFIDEFGSNCVFIFTGNYKNKIIEPLLDRLQVYDFNEFKKSDIVKPIFERLKFILESENTEFEPKDLVPVINTYYPKIRSMVGALQKFTVNGKFTVNETDLDDLDVFSKIMSLVSPQSYQDMILAVNELNAPSNVYGFLYKNANQFFPSESYPNVVVLVAKYQDMAVQARDEHLCCSACLTELMKFK